MIIKGEESREVGGKREEEREIGSVLLACKTNVQWPAYEVPRYPLWPSGLECPLPRAL